MTLHNHWMTQDFIGQNDSTEKSFAMIAWNGLARILCEGEVNTKAYDTAFEKVRALVGLARKSGLGVAMACKRKDCEDELLDEADYPESGVYAGLIQESREKLLADCHQSLEDKERIRLASQFIDEVCEAVCDAYISGINMGPSFTNNEIRDIVDKGFKHPHEALNEDTNRASEDVPNKTLEDEATEMAFSL